VVHITEPGAGGSAPQREAPEGEAPEGEDQDAVPSRGRRLARLALVMVLVLLVFAGLVAAGGAYVVHRLERSYDRNIQRFGDPFASTPQEDRPVPVDNAAMNVLLLGSDSRISAGDPSQWVVGAQRTDAIMIVHIPADRSAAYVVSIPRDSYVPIPGYGKNKINAAFSFGGPALMVRTVEKLTGVRIDHMVVVDFTGFRDITDALGGVTITVPRATSDERASFRAGTYRMDGATALNYVRQRHHLPGGDFDRERRQQNWIRSVAGEAISTGTLTHPFTLNEVLTALTKSIATDDSFTIGEMRDLAVSLRGIHSDDLAMVTAPVAGTDMIGGTHGPAMSIVLLDRTKDAVLWKAIAQDRMAAWAARNSDAMLSTTVR
jgi:LCP family protein required for cell wall assembly